MRTRIIRSLLTAILLGGTTGGRLAANSNAEATGATPPLAGGLVRLDWLGMKRLARETNAAAFMSIWSLPESQRLAGQTLDKLSLYLAHSLPTNALQLTNFQPVVSNSPAARLLRPILSDLVEEESHVECKGAEWALAARLDETRANLWETNLASVLRGSPGVSALENADGVRRWRMPAGNLLSLVRSPGWMAVGAGPSQTNALIGELLARLRPASGPSAVPATNCWLQAELDLRQVAGALGLGWEPPSGWPTVFLATTGEGQQVVTRGTFDFPKPLALRLDPWSLPTNYPYAPLASFSAVRGLTPWLASLDPWKQLAAGDPPNQFCCWSLLSPPMQTTLVVPHPEAARQVGRLSEWLVAHNRDWFGDFGLAEFVRAPDANGVGWKGLPYLAPRLCAITNGGESLIYATFGAVNTTNVPPLPDLVHVLQETNLVAYTWDYTPARVSQWVYIGQFIRLVAQRGQMAGESAGMHWLVNAAPKLGVFAGALRQTAPNRLSLARRSTVGLSAIELSLLADWLESPGFPRGLHSLLAPGEWSGEQKTAPPPVRPKASKP